MERKKSVSYSEKSLFILGTVTILLIVVSVWQSMTTPLNINVFSLNNITAKVPEGVDILCQEDKIYTENSSISVKLCNDQKIKITHTNARTIELKIDKPIEFYKYYDISNDNYTYYIISKSGNLYSISEKNIINKKYTVIYEEEFKNIVAFKILTEYKNDGYEYNENLYAVDRDGNVFIIENLY